MKNKMNETQVRSQNTSVNMGKKQYFVRQNLKNLIREAKKNENDRHEELRKYLQEKVIPCKKYFHTIDN